MIKNIKLLLKIQQRFKSERPNVFTREINKIALSSNDDKRMQSIDSIEIYGYETSKDLHSKVIQKMINFDDVIKEETKEHNTSWIQIPDHPYRMLTTGGSGSRKTNSLFNLINQQPDIKKVYLCTKDLNKAKYQFLIKKREDVGTNRFNDSKAFIEYSNDMKDIYKNIEEYNPNKERKILIAFDDMIADVLINKKLNPIVTELFIRSRKLNSFFVFITQTYFAVPKDIRLNSTYYFIMKIPNKQKLHRTESHH